MYKIGQKLYVRSEEEIVSWLCQYLFTSRERVLLDQRHWLFGILAHKTASVLSVSGDLCRIKCGPRDDMVFSVTEMPNIFKTTRVKLNTGRIYE